MNQLANNTLPELRPVTALRGVGEALAAKLAPLGIHTVQDVLFHLPFRYEDRTQTQPLGTLQAGMRAVVEGEVQLSEVVFRGRRALLVRISDGSGWLTLRFFHFSGSQQTQLARGARVRCYGEVRPGPQTLEMVHPEYRRVGHDVVVTEESTLTPVYPATEGVQQARLRQLSSAALQELKKNSVRDWLPVELLPNKQWPTLLQALQYVHRPPPDARLELLEQGQHPTQRRLAFEELLAQQLSLRLLRQDIQRDASWALIQGAELIEKFRKTLPFQLTNAQQRVWQEMAVDLAKPHPMLRLVQGDVGSGKTVVAALAAVKAVACGLQAALMAPTELLAEQHARNFARWLEPLGIQVVLLTGKHTGKARASIMESLRSGQASVAIGTHALFQSDVEFSKLAVVIIDEQHRFGVHQRLMLREKGLHQGPGENKYPHQLIMTATPIPRTLAMSAYADLDVSVIDELPPGRTPVQTVVLPDSRRDDIVQRVRDACMQQRQVYWVCPLIEESDLLTAQAAEETHTNLSAALPELRVQLLHGRMNSKQKDAVMDLFKSHQADVLVATTVIEVGVDVPNASVMVIENAERMGLAQLHQLRGRVGRGSAQSSCVLLYQYPLSEVARERLRIMRETNDGFEIARHDLEIRGPGELLGTRQTGLVQLRVADLMRDADLLPQVQQAADALLKHAPERVEPLLRRWVGQSERFGKV
ncbi:MAG: ATP-dependent DNA helicase RecG [Steroidobacteraceae bacterium]